MTTGAAAVDPRYSRQVTVPGVGPAGQAALGRARVLLIGAGGLGSTAALYLAAAGVGTIGIVDDDRVELSNLHRQIVHTTGSIGRAKVDSAADTLHALNPEVRVRTHNVRLSHDNVADLCAGYDMVVDGADNFFTRYLVSDATTVLDIPHVWASVLGAGGQLSVFHASRGPVFRDVFPRVPDPGSVPSCVAAGVLGVVPGVLGVAMAAESLKLILGLGTPLIGTVQLYDMATGTWDSLPVRANPDIARPRTRADIGRDLPQRMSADRLADLLGAQPGAAEVGPAERRGHDAESIEGAGGSGPPTLIDVREPAETAAGTIAGAQLWPLSGLGRPDRGGAPTGAGAAGASGDTTATAGTRDYARLVDLVRTAGPQNVVVYCKSGGRSAAVTAELARLGVSVRDLAGGFDAFARAAPELVDRPRAGAPCG